MKRAVILSPPVSALIFVSSQLRLFCVSWATTRRAPRSLARSVGWRSLRVTLGVAPPRILRPAHRSKLASGPGIAVPDDGHALLEADQRFQAALHQAIAKG